MRAHLAHEPAHSTYVTAKYHFPNVTNTDVFAIYHIIATINA